MVVCKFFQQGNCRFGNDCKFQHIYSSKYSYRAPQVQSNSGHNASGQGMNSAASSLFRNAAKDIYSFESASNNTFAHTQSLKPTVFDRLGPQQISQNNKARSIFAQANQTVFGQTEGAPNVFKNQSRPATNVFHTQNQSTAKSLFAQATQSIFGRNHSPSNTNITTSQKNMTGNVFQITNISGSNVFESENQIISNDANIYSKIVELTKRDIEAFESTDFKLGSIPELPPPKTLCV